ncbi:FAD-binding oxidoreductase [Leekyejoonella antrihumi]|uniref:FAD-binding oxidoreductase n=1 Tax=Leekyejoonella antrihumi TaxID=1660198 RepID=A0A563DUH7_9MICO|nr:FAD-binding oxidoreductase [Leekyejoonella antrihumi]TWP33611.1 FAD-binding oxidoreductase [Leekyejoonella antrihumi]
MTTETRPQSTSLRTDLAADVRGRLLDVGDAGYAEAVTGFNLLVTHRPAVVVVPERAEDIAATVRIAAEHGVPVAVQATGHGAHEAVIEGVLINTSRMNGVSIDEVRRTATVGPGTKWRAVFDRVPYGLGGLCGSTSDVGVVGYTLGGGLPVLGRVHGFAADHVRSMQVVTGDGVLRTVDAEREPELFWGLRGGGGSLGIVTSMTFDLVQVGDIYGGGLFFSGVDAADVFGAYARWVATVPDDMCSSIAFLRLPPLPEIPAPLRGTFTMHVRIAWSGSAEDGERLVAPLRDCAPVLMDSVQMMPYAALDSIHLDPPVPTPFLEAGALHRALTPQLAQMLLTEAGPGSNCPFLLVELRHLGGRLKSAEPANAVGGRHAEFHTLAVQVPMGPTTGDDPLAGFRRSIEPFTDGHFANFERIGADDVGAQQCWSPEQCARLQRARAAYDPQGVLVG